MNTPKRSAGRGVAVLVSISWLWGSATLLQAQGTAFTYQGRIVDNGATATGSYDFQFKIYDAISGGNLVAGPILSPSTAVSNGLFTLTLNSEPAHFPERHAGWRSEPAPREAPAPMQRWEFGVPSIASLRDHSRYGFRVHQRHADHDRHSHSGPTRIRRDRQNLSAAGESGVPSGAVVASFVENDTALLNAGYVRIAATMGTSDEWIQRVPSPRNSHTAVWTGSEMIVWGGVDTGAYTIPAAATTLLPTPGHRRRLPPPRPSAAATLLLGQAPT